MPIFSRQTCEADPSLYPIVLGSLPAYRDPDTRDSFVHLGTFFGCVDLCEKEYELKRVLYPLPGVALGESMICTFHTSITLDHRKGKILVIHFDRARSKIEPLR